MCTYKRKNEARSRNYFVVEKVVSMTDDVCVCSFSYPACNKHARVVFSSVAFSGPQYFPALSHKRHDFLYKKNY